MELPKVAHFRAFKETSDDGGPLSFVASTAGIKRDGLDLDIAGLDISDYLDNPVVLWAHDYGGARLPIGRALGVRKLKTNVKSRIEFDPDDEFAVAVDRKYRNKYLNAVSVGFEPLDFDPQQSRVMKSTLLDISAVPVPGDPSALMERHAAMMRSYTDAGDDDGRTEPCHVCGMPVPLPMVHLAGTYRGHYACAVRVGVAIDDTLTGGMMAVEQSAEGDDTEAGGKTPNILADVAAILTGAGEAISKALTEPEYGDMGADTSAAEALAGLQDALGTQESNDGESGD